MAIYTLPPPHLEGQEPALGGAATGGALPRKRQAWWRVAWRFVWRWLKRLLLAVLLLVLLSSVLAYVYRDKLQALLIQEVSQAVQADVHMDAVGVSFWADFPRISVQLSGLSVKATDSLAFAHELSREPILQAQELAFALDVWRFWQGDYTVEAIRLEDASLRLEQSPDGTWNVETLAKQGARSGTASTPVSYRLQQSKFSNLDLLIVQPSKGFRLAANELTASLKGSWQPNGLEVGVSLNTVLESLQSQHENLLGRLPLSLEGNLLLDPKTGAFSIEQLALAPAHIPLNLSGGMAENEQGELAVNLQLKAAQVPLAQLKASLPAAIQAQLTSYETSGYLSLTGGYVGSFGSDHSPDLDLTFQAVNGRVAAPELPPILDQLAASGALHWNAHQPQAFECHINDATLSVGADTLFANLSYRNLSRPTLDLTLNGRLDLSALAPLLPLDGGYRLAGLVDTRVALSGQVSALASGDIRGLNRAGQVQFQDVSLVIPEVGVPIEHLSGILRLNQSDIQLSDLSVATTGGTWRVNGALNNGLGFLLGHHRHLKAKLAVQGDTLNLDEWARLLDGLDVGESVTTEVADAPEATLEAVLDARVKAFRHQGLLAREVATSFTYASGGGLQIHELKGQGLGGELQLEGRFTPSQWNLKANVDGVDVQALVQAFPQLGEWMLVGDEAHGRLTTRVALSAKPYAKPTPDRLIDPASLVLTGHIELDEGRVDHFRVLDEMDGLFKWKKFRQLSFGRFESHFAIADEVVQVDSLLVQANGYSFRSSGRHGFDQSLDYRVQVTLPAHEWRKSRAALAQSVVQESNDGTAPVSVYLRVTGTADEPVVRLDGRSVGRAVRQAAIREGQEIREASQDAERDLFGMQDTATRDDWIEETPARTRNPFRLGR